MSKSSPSKQDAQASAPNDQMLDMYIAMRKIRTFEERVGELFVRGQSAGSMLHLSIGEEAAAVGVAAEMNTEDTFTTHHRGHGIFLARGADPNLMMAEIAGKDSGYCRGKGGSMHIASMQLGHLGANAIVGGGIPTVVGAGLAAKRNKTGAVSVAFFGDGAMQQGILYESMNLAKLWDLPVLFVCINNQYGMGTRLDRATKAIHLHERAIAFNLNGKSVDGLDVAVVRQAAAELLHAARAGKPGFLAIDCYRFYGHARMDKSPYRDEDEEAQGRSKDAVAFARVALVKNGHKEAELDELDGKIATQMDGAVDFATKAPKPTSESMFAGVYSADEPAPEPLATRLDRILGG